MNLNPGFELCGSLKSEMSNFLPFQAKNKTPFDLIDVRIQL
jgi:hypothetical protein